MKDQANMLREKMDKANDRSEEHVNRDTKVIAVISGKGGVGKSNFTVNFAIALQQLGKKVLIFDLDIGMANIDILLGKTSSKSIVEMLEKDLSIYDIIEVGANNIPFVAGGSGLSNIFEMDRIKYDSFIRELSALDQEYDYILFDMPAGISKNTSHFLLSANEMILVTTPEPTAITDAYAAIKFIHLQDANLPFYMVVNRTRSKREGFSTSQNMANVCLHFLKKEVNYLASIPDDDVVWKSVRSQMPFLLHSPQSKPSKAIYDAAEKYVEKDQSAPIAEKTNFQGFIEKLGGFFSRKGG